MVSNIDPTKPDDGVAAVKDDLRTNLQAAKDEIEALQASVTALEAGGGVSYATSAVAFAVNEAAFGGGAYLRYFYTGAGSANATLENDVADGRMVELVQKAAGVLTGVAGSGVTLFPAASTGNWPAGQHSTTDVNEALVYAREPSGTLLPPLADGTVVLASTGDVAMAPSLTFQITIGNNQNRAVVIPVSAEDDGVLGSVITSCFLDPGGLDEAEFTEVAVATQGVTNAHVFVLIAPPIGTFDVTITASDDMIIAAAARSYHRCKQSLPTLTATNNNPVTGTTISTILNSVLAGSVVVDAVTGSSDTPSLTSDDATDTEFTFASFATAGTASAGRAEKFVSSAGDVTRAWTWGSQQARRVIVATAIEGVTDSVWRQISRPPAA